MYQFAYIFSKIFQGPPESLGLQYFMLLFLLPLLPFCVNNVHDVLCYLNSLLVVEWLIYCKSISSVSNIKNFNLFTNLYSSLTQLF